MPRDRCGGQGAEGLSGGGRDFQSEEGSVVVGRWTHACYNPQNCHQTKACSLPL